MIQTNRTESLWYDKYLYKILRITHLLKGDRFWQYQRIRYSDLVQKDCKQNSNVVLTSEEKKEIDGLYLPYYHIRYSAHELYKSVTGRFDKRVIPNGIHSAIIDRYFNNWNMASTLDNKCYYPIIFRGINMPQMIVYRLGGLWYDEEGRVVSYNQVVCIINQYNELFLKKATDSWGGLGVHYYNKEKESIEDLLKIIEGMSGDIVVQDCIHQCEALAKLNPSSVNTVRIMTRLMNDGSVKIYSAILRMGTGDSKVDNATSGGISVGIHSDGRLKSVAYTPSGLRFDEIHPTTKVKFEDIVIPNFDKMQQMVVSLQAKFPHFRLISWDLASNYDNEPLLRGVL